MSELNPIVEKLLKQRNIDEASMSDFLSDSPKTTYDPYLLKDMREGIELLMKYIQSGEKICIYGDYDADGITSVTIMMEVLGRLTDNLYYYIPSRFDEGYGLNIAAIDRIIEDGAKLIFTVDCGSVSYDEVEYAKSRGIDMIVTDHHNIEDTRADCIVINPKQEDCSYPFKGLAGCGVCYKFICALQDRAGLDKRIKKEVLDLVTIGTVGDIVPLLDENRTLVKYGLKYLRTSRRKGLAALFESVGVDQKTVTEDNLSFYVVPPINAAGRIQDAGLAVEILLSDDDRFVKDGVNELLGRNAQRKTLQEAAFEKCVDLVEANLKDRSFLVVRCDDAHEGITGIVAGKLKDRYHRPVVIVTPTGEYLKGTGRSIKSIDLYDVLKVHQDKFLKFGGHKGACGFTMEEAYLDEMADALHNSVQDMILRNPKLLEEEIYYDMAIRPDEVSLDTYEDIMVLAPFGHDNEKPVFDIRVSRIDHVAFMGNQEQHARFMAYGKDGSHFKCLLFHRAGEFKDILKNNGNLEVVLTGTLDKNTWQGISNIELKVSYLRRG